MEENRPVLSTEQKLNIRELQLQESLARLNAATAQHQHEVAARNLSDQFKALTIDGYVLGANTLEYAAQEPAPQEK